MSGIRQYLSYASLLLLMITINQSYASAWYQQTYKGQASYYHANGTGNCSFSPSPQNLNVVALNNRDYQRSNSCGAFIEVEGPKGKAIVRVVDRCPGCKPGGLDLSKQAFQQVADLRQGRVPVRWRFIPGNVTGNIQVKFTKGTGGRFLALTVLNHKYPVRSVALRNGQGQWFELQRKPYNIFVRRARFGQGPFTLRLTDIRNEVRLTPIHIKRGQHVTTEVQF
ncbi:hypothetical protein KCM76_19950 [Zooshikella marina]|uniref:RlpA-like protein double-psi beta-barrel domain-containing protein n=1 Tax=Zooshikella ganghwensis TaxID=202772 RepID=A0A4P9VMH4_9GAMM|nr:expansin EXLX1 family cellulose-binding protein [Zooshikella ganghwensis]MBU2708275.1 hypothetical protein [Zooshikella ganghwensis]RDH44086.1 hypothetical protein B9G39_11850 [Zooshikella ganghwensis]